MPVGNYQDLSTAQGERKYLKRIVANLSGVASLPGINFLFRHTFPGACGYISRLKKKGKRAEALLFIVEELSTDRYKVKETHRWWHLMRLGICLAQDYQIQNNLYLPAVEKLMRLVLTGPEPRIGYDCAYALIGLSLWAFQVGDLKLAIYISQQAILADPLWGYPHYLLGWFGLFDFEVDSVSHFEEALKCNWSFFHRIMNDPICLQHPEILSKLRKRMLIPHENASSRSKGTS